jgi:hypothetical protein
MPYIKIPNGNRFVIRPFREYVPAERNVRSLISRTIRDNSKEYGSFCSIRKIADEYSITYSQDSGVLLGESIARYFDYKPNILWCEEVETNSQSEKKVAIVVVRNGRIMLDAEMPATAVSEDIGIGIGNGDEKFSIYTFGDVPVQEYESPGGFNCVRIEEKRTESFTVLKSGILELLEPSKEDFLFTPNKALDIAGFKSHSLLYTLLTIVLIVGFYWLAIYEPKKEEVVIVDNYISYKQSINTIAPSDQLISIASRMIDIWSIPSWKMKVMTMDKGGNTVYLLEPQSGTDISLRDVAAKVKSMGFSVEPEKENLKLKESLAQRLPKRSGQYHIASLSDSVYDLSSSLAKHDSLRVYIDTLVAGEYHRQRHISFIINGFTLPDFYWLAVELDGYPARIEELVLSEDSFMFKGNIKIIVYGY